jgi:hypothetical protein
LPPDETAREEFGAKAGDAVPVGLGVVVQAPHIIEVLERDELQEQRSKEAPTKLVYGLQNLQKEE